MLLPLQNVEAKGIGNKLNSDEFPQGENVLPNVEVNLILLSLALLKKILT